MKQSIETKFGSAWISLENEAGLHVVLCSRGASIYSVRLFGAPMTVAPKDEKHFLGKNGPFYGKTIGPFAGRCRDGIVFYDDENALLPDGPNHVSLHSEGENYAFLEFAFSIEETEEGIACRFVSKTRDLVEITYLLRRCENALRVEMKARNDEEIRPFNLTNHVYWNLGGEADVLSEKLCIPAKAVVVYDEDLIPASFVPASGAFDFDFPKLIGTDVSLLEGENTHGYDNYFVFASSKEGNPNAWLQSKEYKMELFTDAPGVQLYGLNFHEDIELESGRRETRRCGIAMEPALIPHPLDGEALKKPGEPFERFFEYRFEKIS